MNIASVVRVREYERAAVDNGATEYQLMLRAGNGAARIISEVFPARKRTVVLCGGGNNGGDALAVAALLGGEVIIYALKAPGELKGAAGCAAKDLPGNIKIVVTEKLPDDVFQPGDLIVDGLLGIGFSGGKLRESVAGYIRAVNQSRCRVVALDVPSGLDCDTGEICDDCIRADLTVTFGAVKKGMLLGKGPAVCGVVRAVDIGLPVPQEDFYAVTFDEARKLFPRFSADVHKNSRGSLMIAAGSCEYSGAAALTAVSALRCGAGIVRLATVGARKNVPYSVIVRDFEDRSGVMPAEIWQECTDWLKASSALAAGPGWGSAAPELLAGALDFPGPVVLDADALNILSHYTELWKKREDVVMTPHPGEAKRLAEAFGVAILPRPEFAAALAEKLGAVILLKGKFTVVASPDGRCAVVLAGSPALATAGSGDVLTGIIGALLAMGMPVFDAAVLGASLHGRAGEIAGYGMIADDLPGVLKDLLKEL